MKSMILIAVLMAGTTASAATVHTTASCASTTGHFGGTQTRQSQSLEFTATELKDIVLGDRQVEDAPMPYPSDVVVAPKVQDLQEVPLTLQTTPHGYKKTIYFTLTSANTADQQVFCTVVQIWAL
ncbi:MAG: hypothetical protein AB7G93_04920 [Bdellovibrionales bacterium]